MSRSKILPESFYTRDRVTDVARDLLGKVLVTAFEGNLTSGMIVETEAYAGASDRAAHSFGGRRTPRNEAMYARGGTGYVFLCYGIHHLFNVVTNIEDEPEAVLIRGLEPLEGIDTMLARRGMAALKPALTAGPGAMGKAMGIFTHHTGADLSGGEIWIEDRGVKLTDAQIETGTRVGVAYAKEDAYLPYRFWIRGNAYVSKAKGL